MIFFQSGPYFILVSGMVVYCNPVGVRVSECVGGGGGGGGKVWLSNHKSLNVTTKISKTIKPDVQRICIISLKLTSSISM